MSSARSPWVYMVVRSEDGNARRKTWWNLLNWLPIRMRDQVLFAEALSQAIVSGMDVSSAIQSVALTTSSQRFRYSLQEMTAYCRQGNSLSSSLSKVAVPTSKFLKAALDVGETRGRVAEELAAFALARDPNASRRLAASLGRSDEVTRFARSLARLLADHRLTVNLVEDAAALASGKGSRFCRTMQQVTEDMRSGDSLAQAMQRQPSRFDTFLCDLIAASSGRDGLRRTLERACGSK